MLASEAASTPFLQESLPGGKLKNVLEIEDEAR